MTEAEIEEIPEEQGDELLAEYRSEAARLHGEFKERFITPLIRLRTIPTDCLIFAGGFGHMIGCFCQKDLVMRHGGQPSAKANVSKYIKEFSRSIRLPAIQGQRDADAANRMRQARKSQLTTPQNERTQPTNKISAHG